MPADAPTASYCATRQFGAATITVINDGDVAVPTTHFFRPEARAWLAVHGYTFPGDTVAASQLILHVALGDASIIIDPAFDDPGTPWDAHFATRWPHVERTPGLAKALDALGIAPDRITDVILSHAHDDHFAGALRDHGGRLRARFPHARHLIGRADWTDNPKRDEPDSALATRLGPLAARDQLVAVEGEFEVAPGVTMLPAPGESPGHQIVRVTSDGATLYYVADLFHHESEFSNPAWYARWNDPAALVAARRAFLALVGPDDTVIFAHAPFPGWGHIVRDQAGFRWEATR